MEESVGSLLAQCCSGRDDGDSPRNDGKVDPGPGVKVIPWEEYQQQLSQLCSLADAVNAARATREELSQRVCHLAQAHSNPLERRDALETMRARVESRREYLHNAKSRAEHKAQQVASTNHRLAESGEQLLTAARALGDARVRLEEDGRVVAAERGKLTILKNALTTRRRCMVAQAAALYPLVSCTAEKKCPQYAHQPGGGPDDNPMTISGLHVIPPVKKEAALFTDKREYENSATALGYVAHMTILVSRYLGIWLRYPVRFQASRSYMQDFSPATEPPRSSGGGAVLLPVSDNGLVEFPLFSDGQDPTRAAYAVFLLNKASCVFALASSHQVQDLEIILNHLGATSVGPRHVLPNLHRILRTIFQDARLLT